MSKRRWLVSVGAGSLLLTGAITADPFGSAARQDNALTGDEARAAEIALAAYPGAEVREIESEEEGGRLLWEVELSNDVEVEIDLETGEIVDSEVGDDGEDEGTVARLLSVVPFVGSDDEDEREGADEAITGSALEQASAAALEYVGEGRVTDTEVGDEEGYYEVEVTLEDGRQVDVHLDENFEVLGDEVDGREDDDEE